MIEKPISHHEKEEKVETESMPPKMKSPPKALPDDDIEPEPVVIDDLSDYALS